MVNSDPFVSTVSWAHLQRGLQIVPISLSETFHCTRFLGSQNTGVSLFQVPDIVAICEVTTFGVESVFRAGKQDRWRVSNKVSQKGLHGLWEDGISFTIGNKRGRREQIVVRRFRMPPSENFGRGKREREVQCWRGVSGPNLHCNGG